MMGARGLFGLFGDAVTSVNGQTGVVTVAPQSYFTSCDADFTAQNVTTVQPIFPAAQDTFTSAANMLYRFELFMSVTNGATTCTKALAFGGTAVLSSLRYWFMSQHIALNAQGATQNTGHVDTAASTVVLSTGTASWFTVASGHIRVTTAGTIIPQFQLSADPTGTILVKKDSYMILTPRGVDTLASVGAWT